MKIAKQVARRRYGQRVVVPVMCRSWEQVRAALKVAVRGDTILIADGVQARGE